MNRKKPVKSVVAVLMSVCMIVTMLGGCTGDDDSSSHPTEVDSAVGRQNGFDDPAKPDNYLEVTFRSEDVDAVAEDFKADLKKKYDSVITEEQYMLDRAGSCVQISAYQAKKDKAPKDSMQTVYIIPAANGCLIAAAHCTIESAEGFGARFTYMINTISILGR